MLDFKSFEKRVSAIMEENEAIAITDKELFVIITKTDEEYWAYTLSRSFGQNEIKSKLIQSSF